MLLGLQEETALLGWGGRFQPCSKLIKCCSAGIPVSVSWGNWSPRLRHRPALGAPSNPPWARGSCSPDAWGGWYIPDSMPLSGVPGGWAAGFPRGGPVRVAGVGWGGALPLEVSPALSIWGCLWAARPTMDEKPRSTRHSRVWVTTTEDKEQPRGWHLHGLTFDMKGIVSVAWSALAGITLCYKAVSVGVLLPSWHFISLSSATVLCTNSSMAENFKGLNRSFPTSSPWNSWKMSPIMQAFCKMSWKERRAYCPFCK